MAENTEKNIYCVIDFPYSQELNVKNILNEKFENLQKSMVIQ